jgi:hypothetical protein
VDAAMMPNDPTSYGLLTRRKMLAPLVAARSTFTGKHLSAFAGS